METTIQGLKDAIGDIDGSAAIEDLRKMIKKLEDNSVSIDTFEVRIAEMKRVTAAQQTQWEGFANSAVATAKGEITSEYTTAINTATEKLVSNTALTTKLQETIDNVVTQINVAGIKDAYELADQKLLDSVTVLAKKIATVNTAIADLGLRIEAKINPMINVINSNLNNMITSVIYQGENLDLIYDKVAGVGASHSYTESKPELSTKDKDGKIIYFPNAAHASKVTLNVGEYNVKAEAGRIFATINPADVDFDGSKFELESSAGKKPSIALGVAKPSDYELQVKTRAASHNGFYEMEALFTGAKEKEPTDNKLYALCATYNADTLITTNDNKVERKSIKKTVRSKYDIHFDFAKVTAAEVGDISIDGEDATTANGIIVFGELKGSLLLRTNGKRIYKSYLEAADDETKKAVSGIPAGVLEGDSHSSNPLSVGKESKNKVLKFKWSVLNYDGSIVVKEFEVIFSEAVFASETIEMTLPASPTVNSVVGFDAKMKALPFFSNVVNRDVWNGAVASAEIINKNGLFLEKVKFFDKDNNELALSAAGVAAKVAKFALPFTLGSVVLGKEATQIINFKDVNGNIVNTVSVKVNFSMPTLATPPSMRKPAAFGFGGDKDLTVAWAVKKANNSYVEYILDGSFNGVSKTGKFMITGNDYIGDDGKGASSGDSYYTFGDNTKYKDAVEKNAYGFKVGDDHNKIQANFKAVVDGKVFNLSNGVSYFGQSALISNFDESIKFKFVSPVEYGALNKSRVLPELSFQYPFENKTQEINLNGDKGFKMYDHSTNNPTGSRIELTDERIASWEIVVASDQNNLIGNINYKLSDGVKNGTIIITHVPSQTFLPNDVKIGLVLKITDVFGCTAEVPFEMTLKGTQG